jgi:PAS domain S-box-containing protein
MNAGFDLSGYVLETLHVNGEFILDRGRRPDGGDSILVLRPEHTHTEEANCQRLEHEYVLASELDAAWATCPLALKRHRGRPVLVLSDPGGTPLDCLLGEPLEVERFLTVAIGLAAALGQAHARDLVHKDIKPANILVDAHGKVWLTGFGLAVKVSPQRHAVTPPLIIKGSWAYMAPEQTGRVNRFVDTRSDLYSLGITLYEMLTGALPFVASDPLEWIHCHIARQPTPLRTRRRDVPKQIEAIVLKLLAKTGEDRYQTASGLEADLQRCLQSWTAQGEIGSFTLAANDLRDRLSIPDSLYGRDRHIADALSAFERVASTGEPEIVLVSGPAGIGKSSMMNELQMRLTETSCLFASGKSDQFKLDIPYPAMATALQGLVRRLLGLSGAELDRWRRQLLEALGPNGLLMVNLVPELAVIIGEQSPPPDLPPHEAQSRFHAVFRRFLAAFAQPAHPLTLFMDDLQWLDTATLELIERLAVQPQVRHLMLIGAYRDDEIPPDHRLTATLTALHNAKCRLFDLRVGPLTRDELTQLIADTLRADRGEVKPLAQLLLDKTKGNPFFVVQFLKALRDEGLLFFDTEADAWRWDTDGIAAKRITDNVAELLADKLTRLPDDALEAVKHLACLGNGSRLATLCLVTGRSERQMNDALGEAVRAGFVLPVDGGYTFSHDRMQEAAYLLIADGARAATHLRIGRALVSKLPPAAVQEYIFEVVEQFGHGAVLMHSYEERAQVAQLYLSAGKRAKNSTAYASGLKYFREGRSLLHPDDWDRQYDLSFELELCQAECEFLTGDQPAAADRLSTLAPRTRSLIDAASVARLRIAIYTLGDPNRAVEVGLTFIRDVGIEWPAHPTEAALRVEIEAMKAFLAGRPIERLVDLPRMTQPVWLAAMDVLASLIMPAKITDNNLENIVIVRMANLSLQHGNCDASSYAYSQLNVVIGLRFGDYKAGLSFGRLGCELVDGYGMERFKARVYCCFSTYVHPWTKHLPACLELNRRALTMADAAGDLVFVSAVANAVVSNLLISGEPLAEVHREADEYLALARKAGFDAATDGAVSVLMLIRELRGLKPDHVPAERAGSDQARFEDYLMRGGDAKGISSAFYWRDQLQARYLLHDPAVAFEAAIKAGKALTAHRSLLDIAEYHYYAALVQAAMCDQASAGQRQQHFDALLAHHEQIAVWAANCPENFGCRAALVAAEISRLGNKHRDALALYEEAIRLAQDHGFVQNEAMANELAARFHAAHGSAALAEISLRAALDCYGRWGAEGKIHRLRQQHPNLSDARSSRAAMPAISDNLQHVDLAAVIAISQAVSSEVVFDRLVERLLVTALEHAGAVRGMMLLPRAGEMQCAAEAVARNGSVEVQLRYQQEGVRELPESILNYVKRSHEIVMLDDALTPNPYSEDRYIRIAKPRSVLCMPLLKQQQLVAVLYIENSLLPSVFTPERLLVLQIIGSQAAISIENAKLFADLNEAREQARRAEEQNQQLFDMIPALAWRATPTGVIDAINKQWTDYTGISTEEAHRGEWMRAYPGVDGQTALNQYAQLFSKGIAGTVETWLRRHDGEVRWFLHRVAPLYDARGEIIHWHGTATDIDDLKRAQALILSEKDLLQMNSEVHTLTEILEALIRSVEKQIDGSSAAILLKDSAAQSFYHVAAPNLPTSYTTALDQTRGGPFNIVGASPTDGGHNIIVADITHDPSWTDYQELAAANGLRSCWSTEISAADGSALGILAVYARRLREITDREIGVCEQFAHLASVILGRKRAEDALKGMNLKLQESLHEKESLLKEVHHRVKNNLQLISSMLSLQASRITDDAVAELFSESRNRVRSMALVHENLYRAGNFSKISMLAHIETLSASLARAYGLNGGNIELRAEVEDISLDLDIAIPVGLIVNELTSNALKHAFPDGRRGRVHIGLRRLGPTRCELTLRDNGIGMAGPIDPRHNDSMGLQLVHDLTEQLRGSIAVTGEGGTTFTLCFDSEDRMETRA